MATCKKCKSKYPDERLEMGYDVCIDCSTEESWSCGSLTYHKTGNSIEIIKDPEVAHNFNQMASRKSFGVMSGITGRYKKYVKAKDNVSTPVDFNDMTGKVYSNNRKSLGTLDGETINFETQGSKAMTILETEGSSAAIDWLKKEYRKLKLSKDDFVKLVQMVKMIDL